MEHLPQLGPELHRIAWSAVSGPASDPWADVPGSREERRAGALQLLAIYSRMVDVLQRRIDLVKKEALTTGSDYGQIAKACGVSRQTVRQRWIKRSERNRWFEIRVPEPRPRSSDAPSRLGDYGTVVLFGGPYEGKRDFLSAGEVPVYQADSPPLASGNSLPLLAWYVPGKDDAAVYTFVGVARDLRQPPHKRTVRTAKVRVYELAKELGVDSRAVMSRLNAMGEYVRSAASTVEHDAVQQLREQFQTRRPGDVRPPE